MQKLLAILAVLLFAAPALAQNGGGSPVSSQPTATLPLTGSELILLDQLHNGRMVTMTAPLRFVPGSIGIVNTWALTQTFTVNPVFTACTGYLYGNGTGAATCSASISGAVLAAGSVPGSALGPNAAAINLGYTPSNVFNIQDYGAKCDDVNDDGPAINLAAAAMRAAGQGILSGPAGKICRIATTVDFTKFSATFIYSTAVSLVSGGSGCTNGTQTFTGPAGGTDTPATFQGTVSGGFVTSLTFSPGAGGIYAGALSNPGTLTGGGCSVAPTANITYYTNTFQPNGVIIDLGMTELDCQTAGDVCVDMLGTKHATVRGIWINGASGVNEPSIGLQYGVVRVSPFSTASQINFYSLQINGFFSKASRLNENSEESKTFGGTIRNYETSNTAVVEMVDCYNHNGISSHYTSLNRALDTVGTCEHIIDYGTVFQQTGATSSTLSSSGTNTLTLAALPSNVVIGTAVSDNTHVNKLTWGTVVTGISGNTVTLSNPASGTGGTPTNGDVIGFGAGPAIWLGGTMNALFDRGTYISSQNAYPIYIFNESTQVTTGLEVDSHIEAFPWITSNFLITTGTANAATAPDLIGFVRGGDTTNEAAYSEFALDWANGVTSATLDQIDLKIPGMANSGTPYTEWGAYSNVTAAAVATGGSGCTTGAQTFTIPSTANGGVGASAQITGTVSGGALSGALTIASGGTYQALPSLSTVTLSGGGCSVAPTATLTTASLGVGALSISGSEQIGVNVGHSTPNVQGSMIYQSGLGASATYKFIGGGLYAPNLANGGGYPMCLSSGNQFVHCTGQIAIGASPGGSGSCPITTKLGGNTTGSFVANGVCIGGTVVLTFSTTATNGWACQASDLTSPSNLLTETAYTTTTATLAGNMGNGDLVTFNCTGL